MPNPTVDVSQPILPHLPLVVACQVIVGDGKAPVVVLAQLLTLLEPLECPVQVVDPHQINRMQVGQITHFDASVSKLQLNQRLRRPLTSELLAPNWIIFSSRIC